MIQMLYLDGRELIEFEDCGKRKKLKITEPKNSECLWDCTWRHNPFATQGAESFFEDDFNATDDHPHDSVISYITTPRVPEDLACLRCCLSKDVLTKAVNIFFECSDCFTSVAFEECYTCCGLNTTCEFFPAPDDSACLFKCFREKKEDGGRFFASSFDEMAMEFCRIAESPNATEINLFPNGSCAACWAYS